MKYTIDDLKELLDSINEYLKQFGEGNSLLYKIEETIPKIHTNGETRFEIDGRREYSIKFALKEDGKDYGEGNCMGSWHNMNLSTTNEESEEYFVKFVLKSLLIQGLKEGLVKEKKFMGEINKDSCDKPCGPGDFREGGKCDEEGCYTKKGPIGPTGPLGTHVEKAEEVKDEE